MKYNNSNVDLVSIIIPVYNSDKYILNCLNSLKYQSYSNIEVIIVNDGSNDATLEICQKFLSSDNRFSLLSIQHRGVSYARNFGINVSKGKYIIFIDSDDFVSENYVWTLVESIKKYNTDLVCADYYIVDDSSIRKDCIEKKPEIFDNITAINLLHKEDFFRGYLWNKIFIKEIIVNNNLYFDTDIKIWEDMLFCLEYMLCIKKVVYIRKKIYYYVIHSKSTMNDKTIWNEQTQLKALKKMWNLLQPIDGEFKEYIRDKYANYLVGLLGKSFFNNEEKIIIFVKNLHGRLTFKHCLKFLSYNMLYKAVRK